MAKDERKAAAPAKAAQQPQNQSPETEEPETLPRRKAAGEVMVEVHTPFKLQDDAGVFHEYGVGKQPMSKAHSEHWYAKHHIKGDEE